MLPRLTRKDRLLFIGDSITDVGRREEPDKLGQGYVRYIHHWLHARQPADAPLVLNTGVGGDTIENLAHRWENDVLAHDPNIVSIKIGVNDVWRQFDGQSPGVALDDFRDVYLNLIERTTSALPGVQLVLCEPTVIDPPAPEGAGVIIAQYAQAVREIAGEHAVGPAVPFYETLRQAIDAADDVAWTTDGVHPTPVGHMLLARTWLTSTGHL